MWSNLASFWNWDLAWSWTLKALFSHARFTLISEINAGVAQTVFKNVKYTVMVGLFAPREHHTHSRLTAIFLGLPRWAGTRKAKPIWILLKQETVSGSGISWNICKSAPHSRQITTPEPHHSVFYRPDALPVAQPTGRASGSISTIYINKAEIQHESCYIHNSRTTLALVSQGGSP